jgi:hypothetical protein
VVRGVNLRAEDHGPATPAELTPRTRHQSLLAGRVLLVNCETLTVVLTMCGDENLLSSSICMR